MRRTRALAIVAQAITPEIRQDIDRDLTEIDRFTSSTIRAKREEYETILHRINELTQPLKPLDFYQDLVQRAEARPEELLLTSKHYIDTELFRTWGQHQPNWAKYPPHTRIGINARADLPQLGRLMERRLLE